MPSTTRKALLVLISIIVVFWAFCFLLVFIPFLTISAFCIIILAWTAIWITLWITISQFLFVRGLSYSEACLKWFLGLFNIEVAWLNAALARPPVGTERSRMRTVLETQLETRAAVRDTQNADLDRARVEMLEQVEELEHQTRGQTLAAALEESRLLQLRCEVNEALLWEARRRQVEADSAALAIGDPSRDFRESLGPRLSAQVRTVHQAQQALARRAPGTMRPTLGPWGTREPQPVIDFMRPPTPPTHPTPVTLERDPTYVSPVISPLFRNPEAEAFPFA